MYFLLVFIKSRYMIRLKFLQLLNIEKKIMSLRKGTLSFIGTHLFIFMFRHQKAAIYVFFKIIDNLIYRDDI